MGAPGEIGAETIGRGEAGAFADKDEAEAGSEKDTYRVAHGDPALLHQSEWSDGPACGEELRKKMRKQRNGVAFDGESREAIGNDNRASHRSAGLKLRGGVRA